MIYILLTSLPLLGQWFWGWRGSVVCTRHEFDINHESIQDLPIRNCSVWDTPVDPVWNEKLKE